MTTEIVGRYVDVDGVKTYYESAGDGDGLLCLHTAGRDSRQWHNFLTHYGDRYRVVALDMPGHWKSWPLPGNRCITDAGEYEEFIWRFTNAIELQKPVVAGCSVGGNMVFLLAQRHSVDVKALISFQGAAFSPPAAPPEILRHPQVHIGDYLYDRGNGLLGRDTPPDIREEIMWTFRQATQEAQHGDLSVYGNFDVRAGMARITCPSLLIRGTGDWIVTQEMVEQTRDLLVNAEIAELELLEGAGHLSHVEAFDRCRDLIDSFLARVEQGRGGEAAIGAKETP